MGKARDDLHRLVDALPEQQAILAKRILQVLLDEIEEDTEPLSCEEQAALEEGRKQAAKGETVSWKVLREELDREV